MAHPHPGRHRRDHDTKDARTLRAAVVTVSDTRTLVDDEGGGAIVDALRGAGHHVDLRTIVKDDRAAIEVAVRAAIDAGLDVVITTGGTGIAPRDVTYEAVVSMLGKTLDGFGEAFRRLSWEEVGARAILSRAVAGSIGRTLVIALPGSVAAVRLAMAQLVLPVVAHAVGLLRGA